MMVFFVFLKTLILTGEAGGIIDSIDKQHNEMACSINSTVEKLQDTLTKQLSLSWKLKKTPVMVKASSRH